MSPGDGGTCLHGRPLLICQECAGPYFMGVRNPQPVAFDDATIVKLFKSERERARLAALEAVAEAAQWVLHHYHRINDISYDAEGALCDAADVLEAALQRLEAGT